MLWRLSPAAYHPSSGQGMLRGYALIMQRRFRLLQQANLALVRERVRAGRPRRPWREAYAVRRGGEPAARRAQEGFSYSTKAVVRALESLHRHVGVAHMTASYSTWFNTRTRTHLGRCASVLRLQLLPLQLYGHPA